MAIDRNTRPKTHAFRLSPADLEVLCEVLFAVDDPTLELAWHQIYTFRALPEADRIPVWRALSRSDLSSAFADYRLDWDRIAPAVDRVKAEGLVPDDFWFLGRFRYKIPGGEFYDRGHFDVHLPTAEIHQALYDAFVEDGLAEWEQRGGRRFLSWHRDMWVHDDPRRVKPRA
jgi:hypothetical protein